MKMNRSAKCALIGLVALAPIPPARADVAPAPVFQSKFSAGAAALAREFDCTPWKLKRPDSSDLSWATCTATRNGKYLGRKDFYYGFVEVWKSPHRDAVESVSFRICGRSMPRNPAQEHADFLLLQEFVRNAFPHWRGSDAWVATAVHRALEHKDGLLIWRLSLIRRDGLTLAVGPDDLVDTDGEFIIVAVTRGKSVDPFFTPGFYDDTDK